MIHTSKGLAASVALAMTMTVTLVGCDSGTPSSPAEAPDPDRNAPDATQGDARAAVGCSWLVVSDIETTNIAFPDEGARYWLAVAPNIPGARLRIDGHYPDTRYFSFNVYDPLARPVDAIADFEIAPEQSGTNPFRNTRAAPGAPYTAFVAFEGKPSTPAANTIYSGQVDLGPGVPNPLTVMLYRTYAPADFDDFQGGVGLPRLTLELPGPEQASVPLGDCEQAPLPNAFGVLPGLSLNEVIEGADYPDALDQALGLNLPLGTNPPTTRVFYGLPDTAVGILGNVLPAGIAVDGLVPDAASGGGGFLSNVHNAYTSSAFDRAFGSIYLMRARAPSYPGDPRLQASGAPPDLRYWSICQNEFVTQRFVECSIDQETPLDAEGFFTVAVSDPADRPANAVADNDVAWLPWGGIYKDGILIYRHMLPAADFAQAIHNVPKGTDPRAVMGDYFPEVTYCTRPTFEAAGASAEAIFAACQSEQAANDGGPLAALGANRTP